MRALVRNRKVKKVFQLTAKWMRQSASLDGGANACCLFRQRVHDVPVGLTPLAPGNVSHTKPIRGVGTSLG